MATNPILTKTLTVVAASFGSRLLFHGEAHGYRGPRFFHNPPDDNKGGGKNKTLDEQLSEANTALATAQSSVTSLTSERDTAVRERDEARNNAANLQTQFDSLTQTATQLRTDLATAQTDLATRTRERDEARTTNANKDTRIENLSKLCGVKGISTDAAPESLIEAPGGGETRETLTAQLEKTTDPAERGKIGEKLRQLSLKKQNSQG